MQSLTNEKPSPLPLRERGQGARGFPRDGATANHAVNADHRTAAMAGFFFSAETLGAYPREYPSPLPLSLNGRGDNLGVSTKSGRG